LLLSALVSRSGSLESAQRSLPVFLVLHGTDGSAKIAFPLKVHLEFQIQRRGPEPRTTQHVRECRWEGVGRDAVETLGQVQVPSDLGVSPQAGVELKGTFKLLRVVDALGKPVLKLKDTEGPMVVVGKKAQGVNLRFNFTWDPEGKLGLDMNLDALE
jgi:hypothetical protein